MSTKAFSHRPLHPGGRTIRVLSIVPSADVSSIIQVNLNEISLDEDALPQALSYVWGDAKDTILIEVNGKEFRVTRNCEQALRHLRHATEPKSLWIDAICIDQQNVAERGQQVGLMAEIYRSAPGILAWLGPRTKDGNATAGNGDLRMAVAFITDVAAQNGADFQTFYNAIVRKWSARWSGVISGMSRIFNHPWWERLWVYQEIILCKEATILLGQDSIPWETVALASGVLVQVAESPGPWVLRDRESKGNLNLWKSLGSVDYAIAKTRDIDRRKAREAHDWELRERTSLTGRQDAEIVEALHAIAAVHLQRRLRVTRYLKCSDPRDRVFALLGTGPLSTNLIVPDYTKSYHEVYWDFAKATAFMTLEFLCSAGMSNSGTDATSGGPQINVPTWVPDLHLIHSDPTHPVDFLGSYKASLEEIGVTEILDGGRVLSVDGHLIDTVDKALPAPFGTDSADQMTILKAFPACGDTREARTRFRKERIRNLVRTWTADTDSMGVRLSEETVSAWIKGNYFMVDAYSGRGSDIENEEDGGGDDADGDDNELSSEGELYEQSSDDDIEKGFAGFVEGIAGFRQVKVGQGRRLLRTQDGRMALGSLLLLS